MEGETELKKAEKMKGERRIKEEDEGGKKTVEDCLQRMHMHLRTNQFIKQHSQIKERVPRYIAFLRIRVYKGVWHELKRKNGRH